MRSNVFKISAIAATIAVSFGAQAAVYKVYQYSPEGVDVDTHGVAVKPDSRTCWSATDCNSNPDQVVIAAETKKYAEGFNYRDESPFLIANGFSYLDTSDLADGFESYCRDYLGYNTSLCEDWGVEQATGYQYELDGNYTNSLAYLSDSGELTFSENVIVNQITDSGEAVGNHRDGSTYRNKGYVAATDLILPTNTSDLKAVHAWQTLGDYTVGSISRSNARDDDDWSSKAAVWKNGSSEPFEMPWIDASANDSDRHVPQGSARGIVDNGTNVYLVGYNSNSDERLVASVFKSTDSGATWTNSFITGFPYDEDEYLNSTLDAVNTKGTAIGTAKLGQSRNGAYINSVFYIADVTSSNLSYQSFSGSIFFTGANGKAGGINEHNEVVGQIDYGTHPESGGGKPRATRAFVTTIGNDSTAPFKGNGYYLDDLTNGDSSNNQYRIIDATDINDASVISGTALYCAGGYDNESIDSTCDGGRQGAEKLVAVKLIPIQNATAADIQVRKSEVSEVKRSGGSLGWLALGLLGLLGFRRK